MPHLPANVFGQYSLIMQSVPLVIPMRGTMSWGIEESKKDKNKDTDSMKNNKDRFHWPIAATYHSKFILKLYRGLQIVNVVK